MRKKKSFYHDYAKSSEYFVDPREKITEQDENIKELEKQKKFVVWLQEYSKKVVTLAVVLYIAQSVFSMILSAISFYQGNPTGLDTLITESNTTFREVVGGYLIKSGIENIVKIGGNYYIGIVDAKIKSIKKDLRDKGQINEQEDQDISYQ